MFSSIALFWALCLVCIMNMMRYFSSLRALLSILRQSDPLLYQSVDGNGFFTAHGQLNKQIRLVHYINSQRYLDHHDPAVVLRCERLRRQFILTSALSGLVVVCLISMLIWY
ncbi:MULTISPECIES: universal stress protein UspB [Photorhabdus]|uniref:universal stress protein UspB n=1 Tax=Photorhabdus TaxID=29487 RepID=UPI003306C517